MDELDSLRVRGVAPPPTPLSDCVEERPRSEDALVAGSFWMR